MDAIRGSFFTDQYLAVAGLMVIGFLFIWLERAISLLLDQAAPSHHARTSAPFLVPPAESQRFSPVNAREGARKHLLPQALAGKSWKPGL